MTKEQSPEAIESIFELLFENKIFAKCPKCGKYLALFEVYNTNCAKCGKISYSNILLINLWD